MIFTDVLRRITAGSLLLTFVFLSLVEARPLSPRPPFNPFLQDEEKEPKKLPPVNWIRSRNVDIKHLAIDLRFDWEKEQAYGSTVVTLTPLMEFDKFTLDAASMTINSVVSGDGKPLQYKYDGDKDNDNLEIALDRVHQPGETIVVKVDYRTNYVNKADGDTAIGSFGKGLRFIKPTVDNPKNRVRYGRRARRNLTAIGFLHTTALTIFAPPSFAQQWTNRTRSFQMERSSRPKRIRTIPVLFIGRWTRPTPIT